VLPDDLRHISGTFASFWVAAEPIPEGEAIVGITGVADASLPLDVPVPDFVIAAEPTARLHHVAVAPERQRRGIGRQLVLTAVEWARENGYKTVILNTPPDQEAAVALYVATGFTVMGRNWFGPYETVWFRLMLAPLNHVQDHTP
jgi:GNAT superfamily N-acetyltransferase